MEHDGAWFDGDGFNVALPSTFSGYSRGCNMKANQILKIRKVFTVCLLLLLGLGLVGTFVPQAEARTTLTKTSQWNITTTESYTDYDIYMNNASIFIDDIGVLNLVNSNIYMNATDSLKFVQVNGLLNLTQNSNILNYTINTYSVFLNGGTFYMRNGIIRGCLGSKNYLLTGYTIFTGKIDFDYVNFYQGGGIRLLSNNNIIKDSVIHNCEIGLSIGLSGSTSSYNRFTNLSIYDVEGRGLADGVSDNHNNYFYNLVVHDTNTVEYTFGVFIEGDNYYFENVQVYKAKMYGLYFDATANNGTVKNGVFHSNSADGFVTASKGAIYLYNITSYDNGDAIGIGTGTNNLLLDGGNFYNNGFAPNQDFGGFCVYENNTNITIKNLNSHNNLYGLRFRKGSEPIHGYVSNFKVYNSIFKDNTQYDIYSLDDNLTNVNLYETYFNTIKVDSWSNGKITARWNDTSWNGYIEMNYTPSTNVNASVTSWSFSNNLTFTVSAPSGSTSTTKVYVGDKGQPTSVSGATNWSYDEATKILTITVVHSSPATITVDWIIPPALIQTLRNNYYAVMTLISIAPIALVAALLVGLVKGKESLDPKAIFGVITLSTLIIIGYIILITIMNALLG